MNFGTSIFFFFCEKTAKKISAIFFTNKVQNQMAMVAKSAAGQNGRQQLAYQRHQERMKSFDQAELEGSELLD
jgi:hypothetical protein